MGDLPDPGLPGIMAVKQVVVAAAAAVVLIVLVVVLVLVLESGVISGRCLLHILLFSLACSHPSAAGQHMMDGLCAVCQSAVADHRLKQCVTATHNTPNKLSCSEEIAQRRVHLMCLRVLCNLSSVG